MRKGSLTDASGSLLFSSFIKPKHDHSHEAYKDGHPEINIQKPVVHRSVLLNQTDYREGKSEPHIYKLKVFRPNFTISAKEAA